jgi:uncharacterized protein (DUF1501 family)
MSISNTTRRDMLRRMTALSTVAGAGSMFGLQLATMGAAAAQAAPTSYKALVCIFLFGGNDANNMLLATDTDTWGRYFTARNTGATPIALMPAGSAATPPGGTSLITGRVLPAGNAAYAFPEAWGGVIPVGSAVANPIPAGTSATTRTFALNPHMGALSSVWDGGRLAAVANVGPLIQPTSKTQYRARSVPLPSNLMSHNDQQSTWQAGAAEGARRGWGGRMADLYAMSVAGNAVFLAGQSVVQYQISASATPATRITAAATPTTTVFTATNAGQRVRDILRDTSGGSFFATDYANRTARSIDTSELLNNTFATPGIAGVPAPTQLMNPITRANETNALATQLHAVARAIASAGTFGLSRQVFFVSMGGFDTHDVQNTSQSPLMARLAHALAYFDGALANLNGVDVRNQVTTFTASDFSRTFTTNGDGTDHAWGAHHFVQGGAVSGGSVYGQFPTLGVDQGAFNNPDMSGNILIPTTSVDQYAGTLGRWFGLADSQLDLIFPNLKNFPQRALPFMRTGTGSSRTTSIPLAPAGPARLTDTNRQGVRPAQQLIGMPVGQFGHEGRRTKITNSGVFA